MVNQTEQPIERNEAPVDTGNTTTDITEEFAGTNTFEDVSASPAEDTTTDPSSSEGQETSDAPSVPSDAPLVADGASPVPPPIDDLTRRIQEVEQQNAQYAQAQYQTQIQQQTEQYRQQLEQQGYLPEQADQIAQNWSSQQGQVAQMQQQQSDYVRHIQGQSAAAEHFAAQYDLNLSDLAELRKHSDPQSMESAARRMKSDREKDAEIARLKAQLVPSQSFDDSQSTPAASTDEGRLLERYNQGDRSSQAQAAARRAAGLG
mgnify:CR=1 FL=1|tara:strand:+ start:7707 stop:8489 length:783 start_codon:yes stop_codon:yes gene_type:complete